MIQLRNIRKDYIAGPNTVEALKGISLSFRENEFVAILGPSGGGKTTLLNIVGGLDKYTSGDLIINGKSTVNFSDREWDSYRNHSVGFVFQSYNLIPHQSVLSNVELALTISQVGAAERKQRAIDALNAVGLSDQINKKPNQLSGGQMQRVAIARALVNNPDIILADEPTGALDTQSSLAVMDLLKEVAKDRLVVMVTHNPDLAEKYATRIIRLSDGLITDDSDPYEEEKKEDDFKYGKTNMSFFTALGLSLNNLLTKKGRTILTSFAGSIGIIGIALILSLSTGVDKYIDDVQANSLSSYPLTIEKQTSDMGSMLQGMASTVRSASRKEGEVSETMVATEMFASVGQNDLRSLKRYIDLNMDEFDQYLAAVKYSYGVSLNVYKSDTSEGIIRVNPSTLLTQLYGEYSSYFSAFASFFSEMSEDQERLQQQYEVLAGRWPESYDECILVVYDRYTISDFLSYQIGLRNPNDFGEIIKAAMNGEEVESVQIGKSFTYEDILNMTYSVVLPGDTYKYNPEFKIYEDMSKDEQYMKQVIADGVQLKIVGIVCPSGDASGLQAGIAYRKDLMTYMINKSHEDELVIKQLENPEVDVFSGRTFEDLNNNASSGADFSSLISIDASKMSKAFGVKINQKDLTNLINRVMNTTMNEATEEVSALSSKVLSSVPQLMSGFMNYYVTHYGVFGNTTYDMNKIEKAALAYLSTAEAQRIIKPIADELGLSTMEVSSLTAKLLGTIMKEYYDYCINNGLNYAAITSDQMGELLAYLLSSSNAQKAIRSYANSLLSKKIQSLTSGIIKDVQPELSKALAKAFYVNPEMLASAFSFNMNEEEMERIITGLMVSGRNNYSLNANLLTLGYADMDDPDSINLYFSDFESKDAFKDILRRYNWAMEEMGQEESAVSYVDITGILMSSITTIINAISYVLIAFVSVSLVVSSIMIAIITYISVLERTKEIGILRALGASKKDVKRVFNAETFIIGLISGVMGIAVTLILIVPINKIIRSATDIQNIGAVLPSKPAMILIVIAVVLTIIAGLIPSSMASRCDPVTALRSE